LHEKIRIIATKNPKKESEREKSDKELQKSTIYGFLCNNFVEEKTGI